MSIVLPNQPSQLAIDITLALNPTDRSAFCYPELYRVTVDGKPSNYAAYVAEEVYRKARLVDDQLGRRGALYPLKVTYTVISDDGRDETDPGVITVLATEATVRSAVQLWLREFGSGWESEDYQKINVDIKNYEYANDWTAAEQEAAIAKASR